MQGQDEAVVAALRVGDLEHAPVTPAERVLLELAQLLTRHAYRCTDADVQRLRDVGWTDPQIAEAVYITAMFAFFNRVADAFGLQDPQFHLRMMRPAPDATATSEQADPGVPTTESRTGESRQGDGSG